MSDHSPYEKLGVSEDASFDEVQDVRARLVEQYSGDAKRLEVIETAYDAILMERLRMRQEGKIKVPERIRFPERSVQPPVQESLPRHEQSPVWLARLLDKPTLPDVALPLLGYASLSAIALFYQTGGDQILQLALLVGVAISVYFLNRKESRLGRSVLLTFIGLVMGLLAGGLISSLLLPQIQLITVTANQFSTVVTFILLWLICSFFK
jgi:Protein CHAPERONE-LIKE PROTEIN OF POR1-like